jgi:hypothetical protein
MVGKTSAQMVDQFLKGAAIAVTEEEQMSKLRASFTVAMNEGEPIGEPEPGPAPGPSVKPEPIAKTVATPEEEQKPPPRPRTNRKPAATPEEEKKPLLQHLRQIQNRLPPVRAGTERSAEAVYPELAVRPEKSC